MNAAVQLFPREERDAQEQRDSHGNESEAWVATLPDDAIAE